MQPTAATTLEVMQKISDAPLKKCPSCGKNTLKKLISAPVFRLKGSGWYETDFKSDQEHKRNLAGADKEAAEKTTPEATAAAPDKTEAKADGKADTKADAKAERRAKGRGQGRGQVAGRRPVRGKACGGGQARGSGGAGAGAAAAGRRNRGGSSPVARRRGQPRHGVGPGALPGRPAPSPRGAGADGERNGAQAHRAPLPDGGAAGMDPDPGHGAGGALHPGSDGPDAAAAARRRCVRRRCSACTSRVSGRCWRSCCCC